MSNEMDNVLGILVSVVLLGAPIILFVGSLIMFCIALMKLLYKQK